MTDVPTPFSHRFQVSRLGNTPKTVELTADAEALARIAEAYGLDSLTRFTATLEVRPWKKAGVFVTGDLEAEGAQRCVVTLVPLPMSVKDHFERAYEPELDPRRRNPDLGEDGEIEIDLEAPEPPDAIEDGMIDLGALVCEQFVLALDPFPRAADAELEFAAPADVEEEEEKPSPFKVLEQLKNKDKP